MNKTSLLMLVVGTVLGIVIGYVTFSTKPAPPEFNIEAEGFRDVGYADGKFNINIVKRVDDDTVDIVKNIQFPADGFLKGYSALKQLVNKLVDEGVLAPTADSDNASNATTEE